jgi:L-lactate dehydrogenase
MQTSTVAIIGAGAVGSTSAYALMLRGIASHIILVDINVKKCEGEVQDLFDAASIQGESRITVGTLKEAAQADIIVIAAGMPQKPGQSRLELLATNKNIIGSMIENMRPFKKEAIIIMVTNPVDILTRYVQDIAGLPRLQIFGSGTFLDSQRLRGLIGAKLSINPNSIHAYVLGEHGDSQFVAWSTAHIGGVPIAQFPQIMKTDLEALALEARQKAYKIIECKGFTSFSVAACVATYCYDILSDAQRVLPVSCFVESLGVCLSMPVVLGRNGIEQMLPLPLNSDEQKKLELCVDVLKKNYNTAR